MVLPIHEVLLDLVYLSTYENANLTRLRRLHALLSRKASRLTRYGMREPNLLAKRQYKLFDILSCKEFLFKHDRYFFNFFIDSNRIESMINFRDIITGIQLQDKNYSFSLKDR